MFSLYREAGANPIAGCLPLLLQAPFLLVLYRLFSTSEGGTGLLDERLAGVPLGHHLGDGLAGAAGPLFGVLLAVLLAVAWWSSRRARRASAAVGTVAGTPIEGPGRPRSAGCCPAAVHDGAGGAGAAARRGDLSGDHERVVGRRTGGAPPPAGGAGAPGVPAVTGNADQRPAATDRRSSRSRRFRTLRITQLTTMRTKTAPIA
ncbi:YidC/Oxa1 family membrane protein insertase [Micromonospora sp. M12]